MAAVLDGVTINFTSNMSEFRTSVALKQVMVQAVEQNLVDTGFIKYSGQALDHFYQAQGITHSFMKTGNDSTDSNNDGNANSRVARTYDADGNKLTQSEDSNNDGTANSILTRTYDSDGNRLTWSNDTNGDSTVNIITTFT